MSFKVKADIDVQGILAAHGLGSSGKVWKFAGSRFKAYCDKYVPMQQGTLKNTAQVISPSNTKCEIIYVQPYAHYQYYGMTMGPNILTKKGWISKAPKGGKFYTGGTLSYQHSPMRGKEWDKRMLADRKQDLLNDIQKYITSLGY